MTTTSWMCSHRASMTTTAMLERRVAELVDAE